MPKAVKITKTNKDYLTQRFVRDESASLTIGLYIVKDFGEQDEDYDILSYGKLILNYDITGVKLRNDFFEIVRKQSSD